MEINLEKIKPIQADLDQKIAAIHNVNNHDTKSKRILAFLVELGELANETRTFKYWSLKDASAKEVILEEYVDGIHFLVSLANDLDIQLDFNVENDKQSLTQQFIKVFTLATNLNDNFNNENIHKLFEQYIKVAISLNFTKDDIINAYMEKNKTNHQRQADGY
ncbi:dUTP diphosphatase [Mycoplasma sp. P36-A1]|uniref:dUTP diphosphatase n=1 Tax=Mycoplasma sp. P36-A1 TaxID=3252900 RepID=UPI003C2EE8C4